jgi:hypothetical protein
LLTEIEDDGKGMNEEGLTSFFDLGNSLGRNDPEKIGEKGHGTKVYFNSAAAVDATAIARFAGSVVIGGFDPGLTPQALCWRLLRRLRGEILFARLVVRFALDKDHAAS